MESDIIIETPARNRYSMYDFSSLPQRQHPIRRDHSFNVSELPKRSRSVMNLSSPTHTFRKHTWVLPESPTVSETQTQLTKRRTISGALSPPAPKVPSIERYLEIFTKLKASYGGFLKVLKDLDRSELSPKENLLFEKCLRKLSNRLQKIHDLNELYIHQEHMREGAKNLLNTMERETSKKIRDRIDDVKSNYKKNVNRLCAIEDEINSLAGSIKIQIIGLIGFARLSPGDVYAVQFKHAYDKSSSKCKVVGQGQKWTNSIASFRVSLLHDLQVKVHEVRKMNSNIIGVVTCPIGNFISLDGQEFVLPVNSTGTLKLKIAVVWSPFSSKEESAFRGKITVTEFPNNRLDSLSDSSLPASPCSTPRNGTLSSMPTISCGSGTLTPVKISVNGDNLASQGSVIRHWKSDEESPQATVVEKDGATWIASIKAQSMPDLAAISNGETNTQIQSAENENNRFNTTNTELKVGPDKSIDTKPAPEAKKKPRPFSLSPAFTSAHYIPPDYENVEITCKVSSGNSEMPSNNNELEKTVQEQSSESSRSEKPIESKPAPEAKKNPRPFSLSPAFTSAHYIPPDYENVEITCKVSSGNSKMPSNNNELEKTVTEQGTESSRSGKPIDSKPAPEVKKKPRPVTLSPAFTSAHYIPPDYENVELTYKGSSGSSATSSNYNELDTKVTKQRPKSLGPSFKMIPSPDYSPPTSPFKVAEPKIPTIIETDFNDPCSSARVSSAEAISTAKDPTPVSETTSLELNGIAVTEAADSDTYNAADDASNTTVGEEDNFISAIRTLTLQIALKIAELPEELRIHVKKLQEIINQLSDSLQEKKKQSLARSVSVENALNSIDSAFDFLAEHQTLKRTPDSDESETRIIPEQFRAVKEVLHCHLICCRNLLENLEIATTPLKIKAEKCERNLSEQTDVLEILFGLITSPKSIFPESACKALENKKALQDLWNETCKENEVFCTREELLQSLRTVKLQGAYFNDEVYSAVLDRLQSYSGYSAQSVVISVFQLVNFFTSFAGKSLASYFQAIQRELRCLKALKSKDDLLVLSTINDREMIPIVPSCLKHLALLLTDKNKTIQNAAASFLIKIPNNIKTKATEICIEILESEDEACRIGACHALSCLEAASARDQIAYVWKNDEREVRKAAFEALKVVGFPEGLLTPTTPRRTTFTEVSTRL